jgi:hypothetical protein
VFPIWTKSGREAFHPLLYNEVFYGWCSIAHSNKIRSGPLKNVHTNEGKVLVKVLYLLLGLSLFK